LDQGWQTSHCAAVVIQKGLNRRNGAWGGRPGRAKLFCASRCNASVAITNKNAVNTARLLVENLKSTKIWLSFDQNSKEVFKQNLNASYFS
jgi:hypothetical protein